MTQMALQHVQSHGAEHGLSAKRLENTDIGIGICIIKPLLVLHVFFQVSPIDQPQ
jgi:hypothetical protein